MLTGTPPLPVLSLNQASCSTTSHCATYFTATSLAIPLAVPYTDITLPTANSQSLHPIYAPPVHVTAEDRQGCGSSSAATISKESSIGPSAPGLGSRGSCTQENSSSADVPSLLSRVLERQITLSVSPQRAHVGIACHHHNTDPSTTTSSSIIVILLSSLRHLPVHVFLQDRLGGIEQSLVEQRDSMTALHSKLDMLLAESKRANDSV